MAQVPGDDAPDVAGKQPLKEDSHNMCYMWYNKKDKNDEVDGWWGMSATEWLRFFLLKAELM